jgi:phage shock protein C
MADHHHHHHHHYYQGSRRGGPAGSPNPHRLYRGPGRVLGGVCSGIAAYFGWRTWIVRVAALILLVMFTAPALIAYLGAWLLLRPRPGEPLYETPEAERFWRTVSTKPRVTFSELRHKFRRIEGRIAEMERAVTSEEYRLKRAFRDLEGKP